MNRILLALLLCCPGLAAAQPSTPLTIGPASETVEITHLAERLEPDGSPRKTATAAGGPARPQVFWLRLDVDNVSNRTFSAVIEAPRTNAMDLEVLSVPPGTSLARAQSLTVSTPNLATFAVVDSVEVQPGLQTLYARITTSRDVRGRFYLAPAETHTAAAETNAWWSGISRGIGFGLLIFNLFIFVQTRDRAYLTFAAMIFASLAWRSYAGGFVQSCCPGRYGGTSTPTLSFITCTLQPYSGFTPHT